MSTPDRRGRTELTEADQHALQQAKRTLRAAVRQRRSARSEAQRTADDNARTALLTQFIGDHARPGLTVASYLSVSPEPSTLQIIAWLAAHDVRVLLPLLEGRGGRPDWALYTGPDELRPGLWGIPEPTGPALGPDALTDADLVLCSGLAATPRGERLGVGGGWFDQALGHARADTVTVCLLNDDEILQTLPAEPHDRRIDVLATPGGLRRSGAAPGIPPSSGARDRD